MSVFGKNDSRCLSNFSQTHVFWNFDHISRTCNQINYTNIWFAKVIIILIMAAQVLFFSMFFPKKTRTLMSLSSLFVWALFMLMCSFYALSLYALFMCSLYSLFVCTLFMRSFYVLFYAFFVFTLFICSFYGLFRVVWKHNWRIKSILVTAGYTTTL